MNASDLFYASRPDGLPHIGDYYFPEGIPDKSSNVSEKIGYIDENRRPFWICYTKVQFDNHLKRNFGVYYPFIPLFISKHL